MSRAQNLFLAALVLVIALTTSPVVWAFLLGALAGFIGHLEFWHDCPVQDELVRGYLRVFFSLLRGQGWRPDLIDWQVNLIRRHRPNHGTDVIAPARGSALWAPEDAQPGDVFQVSYSYNHENYEYIFRPSVDRLVAEWPIYADYRAAASLIPSDQLFVRAVSGAEDLTFLVLPLAGPCGDFYCTLPDRACRPHVADLFRQTQLKNMPICLYAANHDALVYTKIESMSVIDWPASSSSPDTRCNTPEQSPESQ